MTQTVRVDLAIQADIQAEAANDAYEEGLPGEVLLLPGFESFNEIPPQYMGEVAAAMYFDITGRADGDSSHYGQQYIPASFAENLMQRLNYSGSVNPIIDGVTAYGDYLDANFDNYVPSGNRSPGNPDARGRVLPNAFPRQCGQDTDLPPVFY